MGKLIKTESSKILALFEFPMDNSVRVRLFDSVDEIEAYLEEYRNICALIFAMPYQGTIWTQFPLPE